jgi:hypothetical protein
MKVPCPRCGQAWISYALIKPLGQHIYICEACDSMWETTAAIALRTYQDYDTYMRRHGYANGWLHLQLLGEVRSADVARAANLRLGRSFV